MDRGDRSGVIGGRGRERRVDRRDDGHDRREDGQERRLFRRSGEDCSGSPTVAPRRSSLAPGQLAVPLTSRILCCSAGRVRDDAAGNPAMCHHHLAKFLIPRRMTTRLRVAVRARH